MTVTYSLQTNEANSSPADEPAPVLEPSSAIATFSAGLSPSFRQAALTSPLRTSVRYSSALKAWIQSGVPIGVVGSAYSVGTDLSGSSLAQWLQSAHAREDTGPYFNLEATQSRIEQLQAAAEAPSLFGSDDEEEPQTPVSPDAATRSIELLARIDSVARLARLHRVSVFATSGGGLQIQQIRGDSMTSLLIPADSHEPILAEWASDDEYLSKELRGTAEAADFVVNLLR